MAVEIVIAPDPRHDSSRRDDARCVRGYQRRSPVEAILVVLVFGGAPDLEIVGHAVVELSRHIAELGECVVDKALVVEMADIEPIVQAIDESAAARAIARAI